MACRFWSPSLLVIGVSALAPLGGCPDEVLVRDPGGVTGQICNPITGRPAENAQVRCTYVDEAGTEQVREATADELGNFSLAGIGDGTQTVEVTTPEFETSFSVTIASRQTALLEDPACRDLAPPPGQGLITGQICNRHTGEIVTDALITVVLADQTELTTNTNPNDGTFSITVPAGSVVVSVQAENYRKTYLVEVEDEGIHNVEQSTDCAIPDPLSTGFIVGKVCAPGTVDQPLVGAIITARYTGSDGSTYFEGPYESLEDGSFIIDPIGPTVATNVVVKAEKDDFVFSWNVDRVSARVDDIDGVNLSADVACQPLLPNDDRAYLVVEGQYDRIQDVLSRMGLENVDLHDGIPATLNWAEDLFQTQDIINGYDVVFVNCGVEELELARGLSANAVRNIRRYVEQGGSLYVSDWAYELIEQAFPEKIDFFGPDDVHDGAQVAIGGAYTARVIDPDLAAQVTDEMTINFQFQLGSVISQVADDVTIYLETDMQYRRDGNIADILPDTPVTVGFRHGLGKVIFTSFHQEDDETLDGPEDAVLRYLVFEL
jgi:SAM-dependent methyltransferase